MNTDLTTSNPSYCPHAKTARGRNFAPPAADFARCLARTQAGCLLVRCTRAILKGAMAIRLPDPAALQDFRRAVRRHIEAQIASERRASEARKARVIPKVREGVAHARAQGLCGRAWLFGSYAWGEPGERSDVDIFVDGRSDTIAIASVVGRACGLDVHVVDSVDAPDSLHARVMSEGHPL